MKSEAPMRTFLLRLLAGMVLSLCATSGLNVGAKIPDFELPDQYGKQRNFHDLAGRGGLLLVFSRSADW